MATKKMDVPDIGNLLSSISKKRESGELPPSEIQRVEPVETQRSKNVKTPKQENVENFKHEARGAGGRPTVKDRGTEYVKLSPRIPKALKKSVEIALVEERFFDQENRPVTTMDEIVTLALERLLKSSAS
jgi:hypothetical protein